jgi:endonuclease YncB( thermonuclease family)
MWWVFARLCAAGLAAVLLAHTSAAANAGELNGRVIALADGDTLTLLGVDKKEVRVRLEGIDAPETGQAWGMRAKETLSGLVLSKTVRIVTSGRDDYGRTLGRVYVGGTDVNAEMVRTGSAWAYRQYLTDASLLKLEQQARNAKRGLWSMSPDETMPPWDWRHAASVSTRVAAPQAPQSRGQCGPKRYCREMSSCAEARFYLNTCGVRSLDGDHDGTPCENLCR